MTLAIWKPTDWKKGCARKWYSQEGKFNNSPEVLAEIEKRFKEGKTQTKSPWSYIWSCPGGIKNGEATIEKIERLVNKIKDEDLNVCLGQAFPTPGIDKNKFRRTYQELDNHGSDILILDCDKHDASVTKDTTPFERVELCLSRLSIPLNTGWVAYFSSSAGYYKEKDTRISMHIIIILDKVYSHAHIKEYIDTNNDFVDTALGVRSQPLIVANPQFIDIKPDYPKGNEVISNKGNKLSLPKYKELSSVRPPGILSNEFTKLLLEGKYKKLEEYWVKVAEEGRLDGKRGKWLLNTFQRQIFHNRKNVDVILKIIKDNPVIYTDPNKNDRDWSDVEHTYQTALNMVDERLLGKSIADRDKFKIKEVHTKALSLDDIKSLPRENAIILVKSAPNTRKSSVAIEEYRKLCGFKNGIYLSTDKSTISSFTEGRIWAHYLDGGHKPTDKRFWAQRQDWLATTDQSSRFYLDEDEVTYPEGGPFDFVVIDEAEAVHLNITNPNAYQSTRQIYDFCERAKVVMMLDANMTGEVSGSLAHSLSGQTDKPAHLLVNSFDWNSEKEIWMLRSEEQAILAIKMLLDMGEKVYCHVGYANNCEKRRLRRLTKFFANYLGDPNAVKGFTAQDVKEELRRRPNETITRWFKEGLRLLIHSPWSKRSWDYNPLEEGAIKFDANVGIYPHNFISHIDIDQQDWRMRQTKKSFIFITQEKDYKEFKYIEKKALEGAIRIKHDHLPDISLRNAKERKGEMRANVRDAYLEHVRRGGAKIHDDWFEDKLINEFSQELNKISVIDSEIRFIEEHYKDNKKTPGRIKGLEEEKEKLTKPWMKNHSGDVLDIKGLITEIGANELAIEIDEAWNTPKIKEKILEQWFDINQSTNRDFPGERDHESSLAGNDDVSKDVFADLYKRTIKIKREDVKEIINIWDMDEEDRASLDADVPATLAIMKGYILDAVDEVFKDYYPEGIYKFPDLLREEKDILWLGITRSGVTHLKEQINDYYHCFTDGDIPWMLKEHKKYPKRFLEGLFEFYGLGYTSFEKQDGLKEKKNAVRDLYIKEGKINGDNKGWNSKDEFIRQSILKGLIEDGKVRTEEENYQKALAHNYLIEMEDIRSLTIDRKLRQKEYGLKNRRIQKF